MIDNLFAFASTRRRQRAAPLLDDRERYLAYMFEQGVSKGRLRAMASMLLNIVQFLELLEPRTITATELQQGGERWLMEPGIRAARKPANVSISGFTFLAKNWLRFHNRLSDDPVVPGPVDLIAREFLDFLLLVRGFAPETARTYTSRLTAFLNWVLPRREVLSAIILEDVDDFLALKRTEGFRPRSLGSFCAALRAFFRYAETRGWNNAQITRNIRGPRIPRCTSAPKGPKWVDVRRLLDNPLKTPVELRAVAILCLCSIYGLRSSEVVNLKLADFDWVAETFVVHRAKRGRVQQYPIQFEVGEAILSYLQYGRPKCQCRNLFVTLRPPFRPVRSATVWGISADRMKRLDIVSESYGGHSLRHSCATELLYRGSTLKDIADFLGHRDMRSVCIYAKYDMKSLLKVATVSLAGIK